MNEVTFAIRMLGCKVNQYESQVIRENLERFGYCETNERTADVVIINSCTVTDKADIKTRKLIRKIKRGNPAAKMLVTGCCAVYEEDIDLLGSMPEVYKVVPNKVKMELPLLLNSLYKAQNDNSGIQERVSGFQSHTRAFVKIQDGCDQNCSYCKVRLVRGTSRSRERQEILDEITRLAGSGYKEIVLTGICLGSWRGKDGGKLSDLVKQADKLKGEFRIRLSSIEPNHIDGDLIDTLKSSRRICRHLHIPLQSGSDRILALMKRRYNTAQFRGLINNIRSQMPLAGITMDVIVGFPGETDQDFDLTVGLIREIMPSRLHVFRYSDRKGTLSAEMEEKVVPGIAGKRAEDLIRIGKDLQTGFCRNFIDREVEVLVEGGSKGTVLTAYTSEYVKVKLSGFSGREGDLIRIVSSRVDDDPCLLASTADLVE